MQLSTLILILSAGLIRRTCSYYNFNPKITKTVTGDQVLFYLYNRENAWNPLKLQPDNMHQVDVDKNLKILIHGYFENSGAQWYRNITYEYLKKGNSYNVLQVDWSEPASDTYRASSQSAEEVGRLIGELIVNLYENHNLSLSKVHLIGHSLGAHVAGYTGKEVIRQTRFSVARITALDAAGPLFEAPLKMFTGLSKEDADVVDAIHTDGGVFGRWNVTGDADFFPNGGVAPQPGCELSRRLVFPSNYIELKQEVFCNHIKSYYYFTASINQEIFIGVKCSSWKEYLQGKCAGGATAVMGDNYVSSNATEGTFFLRTNSEPPYVRNITN